MATSVEFPIRHALRALRALAPREQSLVLSNAMPNSVILTGYIVINLPTTSTLLVTTMPKRRPATAFLISLLCGIAVLHWTSSYTVLNNNPFLRAASKEFSWQEVVPSKDLKWQPCFRERQCARLIVPLNHSDPDGQEATIALIRKPALIPSTSRFYRGPILFNPGGPGGSGVDLIQGTNGDLLSLIVGPRFDVVGFDPRGIARSTPRVSFFKTDVERSLWSQNGLPTLANNSEEGITRTLARSKVLGQLAAETDYGYLRHINTDQTARDMLRIVEAHGRTKIQYWGFSYGSVLGATFAAMFPDRIERLLIDGVVDSEDYYATLWSKNLLDTDKAVDTFFTGCAEAGPRGCPFWAPTAEDIRQNLTRLYGELRGRPIPVKSDSKYGVFDYILLRSAVFSSLYSPYATFKSLAEGLADLAGGKANAIYDRITAAPYQCECDASKRQFDSVIDAQTAILCNDGDDVPDDLESSEEYFKSVIEGSGWSEIWARIRFSCVYRGWPKFPKDHFQGPFNTSTSHPILLIGNTADPVTPLWAAKKMSKGFKDSVVLTQNSAGHCSISAPSLCTQKYVRQYFVDGTLPEPGTVCEPLGKPFPEPWHENGINKAEELMANMNSEERAMYDAVSKLSQNGPITPAFPFLLEQKYPEVTVRNGKGCN
ncbi:Carboxylesterase A [Psilocybe cubensis]|uniref:Uncharacterized protein n=2 Tax=Psilocybe cubensis TaxID=181762 RepID=A0A8H8CE87_PSICU|nr:Carboxylesterase A [Psilocybe cubensis]KAH9483248.1 Carboxylesterase A [Psilocybe cubensis]